MVPRSVTLIFIRRRTRPRMLFNVTFLRYGTIRKRETSTVRSSSFQWNSLLAQVSSAVVAGEFSPGRGGKKFGTTDELNKIRINPFEHTTNDKINNNPWEIEKERDYLPLKISFVPVYVSRSALYILFAFFSIVSHTTRRHTWKESKV